jgi:hypothetical protein
MSKDSMWREIWKILQNFLATELGPGLSPPDMKWVFVFSVFIAEFNDTILSVVGDVSLNSETHACVHEHLRL